MGWLGFKREDVPSHPNGGEIEMQTQRWSVAIFAAAMLLTRPTADANARPDSAIEKTAEAYRKAVLAGDVTALAATYQPDAVEMPPSRPPLQGRAAIEQYYRELFAGPMKITRFTFSHWKTETAGN